MTSTSRSAIEAQPLERLERALGMPIGRAAWVPNLARGLGQSPRQAMADAVMRALARPPCLLSFSGGRDSSAMLALAVAVARREALPMPIPITLRFPGDENADENVWQDRVIDHLGVTEREIVTVRGDLLDAVGPVAQEVMFRHGLLWPFNAHWHQPMIAQASGGSLITGFGGDELALSSAQLWAERALERGRKLRAADLRSIIGAAAPKPARYLRRLATKNSSLQISPWLTARGVRLSRRALAWEDAGTPLGWDRVLRKSLWPSRWIHYTVHNLAAMAQWYDVEVTHPFVEPTVLAALGRAARWGGMGGRTELMRTLFDDLLPAAAIHRSSKSSFGNSLWTRTAREFVSDWSGEGIDDDLVDAKRLRESFFDRTTSVFSCTLMQQAWLATSGGSRGPTT